MQQKNKKKTEPRCDEIYWAMKMREIEEYLPNGWEEKSRETGVFTCGRVTKTTSDLLALNMMYITGESSFSITAAALNLLRGARIQTIGCIMR